MTDAPTDTMPAPPTDLPPEAEPRLPTLTARPPSGRTTRWTVAAEDGRSELVNPDDGDQVRRAARRLGTTEDAVRQVIAQARAAAVDAAARSRAVVGPIIIRGTDQNPEIPPADFEGVEDALARSPHTFWRWSGTAELAALDIDVIRDGSTFSMDDLLAATSAAAPTPTWAWLTRSGGMRFLFTPDERYGLTAAERAGLFALLVPRATYDVRTAQVELLSNTRRPPEWSRVLRAATEYGVNDMRGALMRTGGREAVPANDVEAWLEDRGMQVGGRYSHDFCPIDPGPSSSVRDPVVVSDEGIRCFRCAARGNGWRSWAAIIGTPSGQPAEPDPIVRAADRLVHWTHARVILQALRPLCPDLVLRAGYRALIRVLHAERWAEVQERAAKVWDETLAIVRGRGMWLHADTLTIHDGIGTLTIKSLPACRSGAEAERFLTSVRLDGYVPVDPVAHVVDRPTWRDDARAPVILVPRPIPTAPIEERIDYAEARERLRAAMGEGVTDRWLDAVDLLVVAGLRAQLQRSVPPIVLLTGATRSGKGAAVEAARGILGLPCARLRFDGPRELAMSIGEGLANGAALLWADEVGKVTDWWHQSTALLQLSTEHTWRKLHAGTVVTPVRAAVVLTGSTLPRGLTTMSEMAARATYVRLPRVPGDVSARWAAGLVAAFGIDDFAALRSTPAGAAVADAYVRAAMAKATGPMSYVSWPEQADGLGAERLGQDAEAREMADILATLYRLWIDGPDEMIIPRGERGAGWMRGWPTGRGDEAAAILAEWVSEDDNEKERRGRFGRLESAVVADLPPGADVSFEVRVRGRRVMARFVSGLAPQSTDRRNRALFPEPLTPPPNP